MSGWQTAAAVLCVVTGTVYDSQHHAVPSAKVYLQDARKQEKVIQTDELGVYRFSVPVGIYEIHAEGEAPIRVTVSKTNTLDLTVQPAFYDEPKFKAAGVTDYTYQGGHGSDWYCDLAGLWQKTYWTATIIPAILEKWTISIKERNC